jgi:hypothetical protein
MIVSPWWRTRSGPLLVVAYQAKGCILPRKSPAALAAGLDSLFFKRGNCKFGNRRQTIIIIIGSGSSCFCSYFSSGVEILWLTVKRYRAQLHFAWARY